MLDTIEQTQGVDGMLAFDPSAGENYPTIARAMVPMLVWPSDLFHTFTAEVDDEFE